MAGTAISVWSKVIEPGQDALVTEDVSIQITQIALELPEDFTESATVKRSVLKMQHLEAEPALLSAAAGIRDDDSDYSGSEFDEDEDDEEIDSDDAEGDESMADISKISKASKASTGSKKGAKVNGADITAELEGEDDDEDDEDDSEFGSEFDRQEAEVQVASLIPGRIEQITTNIVLVGGDDFVFKLSGDYKVHLLGNYIVQPIPEQFQRGGNGDGVDYDSDDDDEYDSEMDDSEMGMYDPETGMLLEEDEDESDEEEDDTRFMEIEDKPATKLQPKKAAKKDAAVKAAVAAAAAAPAASTSAPAAVVADADTSKLSKNQKKKLAKQQKDEAAPAAAAKKAEAKPTAAAAAAPAPVAAAAPAAPVAAKKAASKKTTLPSGLVYEEGKAGSGPAAKSGNRVSMRYIGRLQNGKIFDQNTKGAPFSFKLGKGEVIKGWDQGIAGMQVGSERKLVIPANLAYGKTGVSGIPPNSTLTFEVKLLSIK